MEVLLDRTLLSFTVVMGLTFLNVGRRGLAELRATLLNGLD